MSTKEGNETTAKKLPRLVTATHLLRPFYFQFPPKLQNKPSAKQSKPSEHSPFIPTQASQKKIP